MSARPFLTARWRYLAMLNYEVPPEALLPLVPAGTELDSWQGKTFASVVGFLFLDTRVRGIAIPGHRFDFGDLLSLEPLALLCRFVDGEADPKAAGATPQR